MNNWKKAIIYIDSTIQDVIKNISDSGIRICLVKDKNDCFIGTIADGDIRRALLEGLILKDKIKKIINYNSLIATPKMPRDELINLMIKNKIYQIPIVDSSNKIIGLSLWDDFNKPLEYENKMILMVGGRGTRLQPHTENCPKPMVKVGGSPILEHIILKAKKNGFSNFYLAINHLGHVIEDYFGDGKKFNVNIQYIREKNTLGTAGAISLINSKPNEPFVVTNGDVLTDIDYSKILDYHIKHNACATMAVRIHELQHPFGIIETNGLDIISVNEKPIITNYINAGIYVLSPDAINELDINTHCDMTSLFEKLKNKNKSIIVYPMHEPWLDIGHPNDLIKANNK